MLRMTFVQDSIQQVLRIRSGYHQEFSPNAIITEKRGGGVGGQCRKMCQKVRRTSRHEVPECSTQIVSREMNETSRVHEYSKCDEYKHLKSFTKKKENKCCDISSTVARSAFHPALTCGRCAGGWRGEERKGRGRWGFVGFAFSARPPVSRAAAYLNHFKRLYLRNIQTLSETTKR